MLIKIRLASIRRNPERYRAGEVIYLEGKRTSELVSPKPLPKYLEKYFYLTSQCGTSIYTYAGAGPLPSNTDKLAAWIKRVGAAYTMTHHPRQFVYSRSSPKYLFEYQNPLIPCSECGKRFHVSEFYLQGVMLTDDDEYNADECPNCEAFDSFEYKHERIEDALKRMARPIPEHS